MTYSRKQLDEAWGHEDKSESGLSRKIFLELLDKAKKKANLSYAEAEYLCNALRFTKMDDGKPQDFEICLFQLQDVFYPGQNFSSHSRSYQRAIVNLRRFKQTQLVECFGQREHHVEISCWKQFGFSCLDPTFALYLLALWAMTIPT